MDSKLFIEFTSENGYKKLLSKIGTILLLNLQLSLLFYNNIVILIFFEAWHFSSHQVKYNPTFFGNSKLNPPKIR